LCHKFSHAIHAIGRCEKSPEKYKNEFQSSPNMYNETPEMQAQWHIVARKLSSENWPGRAESISSNNFASKCPPLTCEALTHV
jgi:hypothetical protein